jgi:hypothetical protein
MERDWEKLYRAAVMETDWSRIEEPLQVAETAMGHRLYELSLHQQETREENHAIEQAATALKNLRRDVANWKLKQG